MVFGFVVLLAHDNVNPVNRGLPCEGTISQLAEAVGDARGAHPSVETHPRLVNYPHARRPDGTVALERLGASLFAQHCAACHGAAGEGGAGVRLSGNSRAGDAALSRSVIVTGRGIMPAFSGVLLEDEIDVLVRWVAQNLAVPR
jgi:mono/diheme cytochrome c family protein